jgi:hypothetical protein
MTAVAARRPRTVRRSGVRAVLPWTAVLLVAAFAGMMGLRDGSQTSASDVDAYVAAITPPARQGGFVIQEGMKPAVAGLGRGENVPVIMQAVGWVAQLKQVRADFAKAKVSGELRAAAADFDRALALYIDAAERLGSVGMAGGDVRARLLDKAVAVARQADHVYDTASGELQRVRRRHGLPPSSLFPNPEP